MHTSAKFEGLAQKSSHHNLQKVWSTRKLKEMPAFVRVADWKDTNVIHIGGISYSRYKRYMYTD